MKQALNVEEALTCHRKRIQHRVIHLWKDTAMLANERYDVFTVSTLLFLHFRITKKLITKQFLKSIKLLFKN